MIENWATKWLQNCSFFLQTTSKWCQLSWWVFPGIRNTDNISKTQFLIFVFESNTLFLPLACILVITFVLPSRDYLVVGFFVKISSIFGSKLQKFDHNTRLVVKDLSNLFLGLKIASSTGKELFDSGKKTWKIKTSNLKKKFPKNHGGGN